MIIPSPAGPATDLEVWRVDLDAADLTPALALLSMEERDRAERLCQADDRRRFIVSRAALRRILSAWLGDPPQALQLTAGNHGKPHLVLRGPHFNLSHSGGLAVIAVCRDHAVGVDVEQTGRDLSELDDIARTHFSTGEQTAFFALPTVARPPAFHRLWTRKEAVAKALGLGMSLPGPSFDVSLEAGAPRLLRLAGDVPPGPWSLIDLNLAEGYVGVLAALATGLNLIQRRLNVDTVL